MKELWRPIRSLPGLLASNQGRIMVVPYEKKLPKGGLRSYGGYPTFGQWAEDARRYIYVHKGSTHKVARMVCEAFHGPPSEDKGYCLHLDENARNNRPENLRWGTQKENLNASGFIEYCKSRTGENSPVTKGRRKKENETRPFDVPREGTGLLLTEWHEKTAGENPAMATRYGCP